MKTIYRREGLRILAEWSAIALLGLLYSALFLAGREGLELRYLDPAIRIQAIEHERLSGILIPVQMGLGLTERAPGIGHLPTWNPYLGTGTPLINDAFFYLFNPFMSLPVLLLGAVQGGKVALILGLLMAGYHMWLFARALGLSGVARVTTGALYMLSGGIIAKFSSGHFQLGLSLVWLPLVFAGLWWTLHTTRRSAPIWMAAAFALLFFSGNIYYTLHTLLCAAVITVAHLFSRDTGRWRVRFDRLRRVALGAALALGLTMIQLLPVWAVRDYVSHERVSFDADSHQLAEQYDLGVSVANLVTPWDAWSQFQIPPGTLLAAVDYAYIGPTPFLMWIGLAFVGLKRRRKAAALALLLAVLMMIWGAGQTPLINALYRQSALLAQFRYLGRANAVAALWWIVLAGIAFDRLWRWARQRSSGSTIRVLRPLMVVVVLWGWFLMFSAANHRTRLTLALGNLNLYNTLNDRRFLNYAQAVDALVGLLLIALVLEAGLPPLLRVLRRRGSTARAQIAALGTRMIQIGLIGLALLAFTDLLHTNSHAVVMGLPGNNFGPLYSEALSTDSNPFPSIQEPFGPSAYDSYASRIRRWGLNEGWTPLPLPEDLIPEGAPKLVNLPGWAIVSTEFQRGGTYDLAREFAEAVQGVRESCVSRVAQAGSDPCDIEQNPGSILYRVPLALPYAFTVDADTLFTRADTLHQDNARAVETLSHQMDTITVHASAPDDGQPQYLIVQETHFPGWQAWIDQTPIETATVGAQIPGGATTGFIGIAMQPGMHTYVLRYEPPGFTTGILISLLSLIAIVLYGSGILERAGRALVRRVWNPPETRS
ncbi:MAG: hypothetical protein K8J31_08840 [Anaerolineae bacterium]|nr:hypothetical protein [Anaerolineae bacterium]